MEEEESARSCPCGNEDESRTHVKAERELNKEERNVLEEVRKTGECNMEKCGIEDGNDKTHRYPRRQMVATEGQRGRS